jgi:hypothetical protein
MAKKLYMTTADYLVIAVSPALIMALVGSLVYFLIDVFYEGQYEARLDYAFGLFVFAAVLIARISIDEGREYAAFFAIPLGLAMFLVLLKFMEHPSPFSHVINLLLMVVVWWCADKLTWDSTVIDDDEDASGEGLMQRIGVDGPDAAGGKKAENQPLPPDGAKENEILETEAAKDSPIWQRLKRFVAGRKGPHTPGIWVLYFSLAALPLFGVGQHFVPAADVWRRRYVFFLLLVYVASALALLVTTSFLNLRRYLRQRRIEMPLPIAGTWVGVGAVLIVIVMMLAMLIPRPGAEVALSQVPWKVGSPGSLTASRTAMNRDGGEETGDQKNTTGGEKSTDKGQGNLPPNGQPSENKSNDPNGKDDSGKVQGKGEKSSTDAKSGKQKDNAKRSENSDGTKQKGETTPEKNIAKEGKSDEGSSAKQEKSDAKKQSDSNDGSKSATPPMSHAVDAIRNVSSSLGGLFGVLKILFYVAAAVFVGFCVWKYRQQIMRALSDILRMLRELFGGRRTAAGEDDGEDSTVRPRPRSFSEFRDPFLTGQHGQMPPEELVRYTFAAFEAWANDRGRPRTPDCTPLELMTAAVEPKTPLHSEARKLVRLYGELAYASRRVPRQAADELREIWQLMRSTSAGDINAAAQSG